MTFSSEVKKNITKMSNNQESLLFELMGYCISGNMIDNGEKIEFVTENEFNIEYFYKILFTLKIDYEPDRRGKCYVAIISKDAINKILKELKNIDDENIKHLSKGVFLGAGSINNPEKNYHLEILFSQNEYAILVQSLCKKYEINFKILELKDKYQLYLKEGEEISKFLALIGANSAVLKFEDIRVVKNIKNKINRKVNCETANLNKTIDAALKQIEDINIIKKKNLFEEMPRDLQEIANLRLENPEISLVELGKMLKNPVGKSGVNYRMKAISKFANELKQ